MNETPITPTEEMTTEEAVIVEKPYKFRKLSADDVFLMTKIIGKIGIREFKSCFQDETLGKLIGKFTNKDNKNADVDDNALYALAGVALLPAIDIILGNLDKCKEDIFTLLSSVSGMKVKDIREDAILFMEMLIDFFKKPEFPDFMKVVSKLLK